MNGAIAVSRWEALQGCNYHFRHEEPPHMLDCEHVLFHKCIKQRNNGTIVINQNM